MRGFVPIEKAEVDYDLRQGAIAQACLYPSSANWGQQAAFGSLLQEIHAGLDQGSTVLVGGTGRGKTFHMLLAGFRWQARTAKKIRSAWYASLRNLDTIEAVTFWREFKESHNSLWLIDDVHLNETEFERLLAEFENAKMHRAGHRLLGASWSSPEADVGKIDIALKLQDIAQALRVRGKEPPETELLERLVGMRVGLRWILFENYSQHPDRLIESWRRHFTSEFNETQRSFLMLLAYLEVIGLETRISFASLDLLNAILPLRNTYVCESPVSGLRLIDSDFATLLVRLDLDAWSDPSISSKFAEKFYGRLVELAQHWNLLEEAKFLLNLVQGAAARRAATHLIDRWNLAFFSTLSPQLRTSLFIQIRRVNLERAVKLRRDVIPLFEEELRQTSALGFWKRVRTYSKDPPFLEQLLHSQSQQRLADAMVRKPNTARYIIRPLVRRDPILRRRISKALEERYVEEIDIEEWGHLWHLVGLVDLANTFGGLPNLLRGEETVLAKLRQAVRSGSLAVIFGIAAHLSKRDWLDEPFRTEFLGELKTSLDHEQPQQSLNERLHSLSLFKDHGAERIVERLLRDRPIDFSNARDEFWFLWNSARIFTGARAPVKTRAKLAIANWGTWSANYLSLLSLAGICGSLLDCPSPNVAFSGPVTDVFNRIPEMSPVALMYQLRALSF
ncbi:MAG: hypothetical protein LC776_10525, partial [Acidobacteria bacterium]|nr:hypothetical protein [Acidobacteriota bacterium]